MQHTSKRDKPANKFLACALRLCSFLNCKKILALGRPRIQIFLNVEMLLHVLLLLVPALITHEVIHKNIEENTKPQRQP